MEIDASTMPFNDWVEFFFDRQIDLHSDGAFHEYEFADTPKHTRQLVAHVTRLCQELSFVIDEGGYSWQQVNQAVWGIFGYNKCHFCHHLWVRAVPHNDRLACIRSMYDIFENVVQKIPADVVMENCFFMWWDMVAEGFCESHDHWTDDVFEPTEPDTRDSHDTILETLVRILALKDIRCENAALHGIGHLHHQRGRSIVQRHIDETRNELNERSLRWLEECRDGTVM